MIATCRLDDLDEIVARLMRGEVLAVPTDTVYGVAARFSDATAVARLFDLKGRPRTTALPVMIGDLDQLSILGVEWNDAAATLAGSLWPGPLTIVTRAHDESARRAGSTTGTLGVRMPLDHDLLAVLEATGPLAVTSANAHGEPACHDAAEVQAAFAGSADLDAVVDGGRRDGAVSTVVDVSSTPWRTLRNGAVSDDALRALLG